MLRVNRHLSGPVFLLAVASVFGAEPATNNQGAASWYQEPFLIQAGGRDLDTAPADLGGHAAPFLADIDGDGRRDLVVGSIVGDFRLFRNTGSDSAPKFGAGVEYLMVGNARAAVPGFCCVAAGPQLVDNDNDGILDLTSGSYFPGAFYWFKGSGNGQYQQRQMLTDAGGYPLFVHSESVYDEQKKVESYISNLAWVDWDGDGLLDIVMGNSRGELHVRKQIEGVRLLRMPASGQPVFEPAEFQKEIRIDGMKALPAWHSAPAVADWDGDGVWDIVAGSVQGAVYWLKNTGKPVTPEFGTREEILPPGTALQWLEPGAPVQRGIRSQIQVADYNRDGKPDLLVGAWSISQTPRADLTRRQRREMESIRRELAGLDRKVDFDFNDLRSRSAGYYKDAEANRRMQALQKQLNGYLAAITEGAADADKSDPLATSHYHGHVWVFLRK